MLTEIKSFPIAAASILAAWLVACGSLRAFAHDEPQAAPVAMEAPNALRSNDPRSIAESFNSALARGDADTVRALLLPDVLIYESGGAETSALEYAGHHMPGISPSWRI